VVWWIVAGVTLGALLVLLAAAVATGSRLRELQRVADLAARQADAEQRRLQARAVRVQAAVAELQRRTGETQRLLARFRQPDVR
jgi:type VI protein secretion system component VasK